MKSESVWKVLAISVALLMVASIAGAVNQAGNSSNDAESEVSGSDGTSSMDALSVSVGKHPKMSTEVAVMIPPQGIAPPPKPVIVNIYLNTTETEDIEELKNHTIEIFYVKEKRVVAEIYTSDILEIAYLPFVTYIETPLEDFPETPSEGEVSCANSGAVYKHPKMSAEVAKNVPPPGIAPPANPLTVNIYLKENKTEYIEELRNHTIEILYIKGNRVVTEIYTSQILEIADLHFVTYIETPLEDFPETSSDGEVSCADSGSVYKHPKMSGEIAANIPPPGIAPPAKPTTVNIYLKENRTEYVEELKNHTIEVFYIKEKRVVAEIYTSEILEITDLPFVTYIETPLMDFPEACSGAVISEGGECINADQLQDINITGKGVKIAILDPSFYGYDECQRKCELPEDITVKSFRKDKEGRSRHGTACAEIVHDVAPCAELYLVNYSNLDELEEAVKHLILIEKVDIITRSAGYLVGLFDGTDEICRIIDDAVFKHGIIWANSAGNYAQRHWEGMFSDTDEPKDGWHEYSCTGGELGQNITATRGEIVILTLSWNDTWNFATEDYDLRIFDSGINEVEYIVPPKNPQTGLEGHHPYELCVFEAPSTDTYYIAIQNYSATRPVHFELYAPRHELSCKVENSSLNADACAFGVIAAGAVSCEDCSTLEPYSSRGPTNDGRIKPDFVGPDCVSTYSYGDNGFCGTSAAAPHVAGAIALQLSSVKETHPGQKDNQYGHGLPKFCNCSGMD